MTALRSYLWQDFAPVSVLNFSVDQLRDEKGRWASGSGGASEQLMGKVRHTGGFTYQPVLDNSPKTGMAVSPFQGAEKVIPLGKVTEDDLVAYVRQHADKFADPEVHFGVWTDAEAGKVYLDLSKIVATHEEAIALCKKHNQEGYYDLKAGKTILCKDASERRLASNAGPPKVNLGGRHTGLRQTGNGKTQGTTGKGQGEWLTFYPLPYVTNEGGDNCGIGPGGFQPGNTCARGGSAAISAARGDTGKPEPPKVGTPVPCCLYEPKPSYTKARVGVPADEVPPPPKDGIGRLPNLDADQRRVETNFADGYLKNPDKYVAKYRAALSAGKVGVAPNVYATDDVKMLNKDWNPGRAKAGEKLPMDSREAMAKYNTAVHQTANAIAKKAFVEKLDELQNLPDGHPLKSILVTNGGCAAGKGSTLSHAEEKDSPYNHLVPTAKQVGAVWDAAGEQNATENEWLLKECKSRGIKPTFAYVWAEPKDTWAASDRGVIRRAEKKGRMVDARLFADSYAEGAKNMNTFVDKHKDDPDASFVFIDNRKKGEPKILKDFPRETLKWDGEKIYKDAVDDLKSRKGKLSKSLYEGGLNGQDIWGPPRSK